MSDSPVREIRLLTIETTCDETAAAVISENLEVLGSAVASQDELHARFRGVVPEIASRAHVERILPVIDQALRESKVPLSGLTAVAVANRPGLAGSLLVGLAAAKALALALEIPLVAIDHLQAHVYACRMANGPEVFPCVGLIASGGHSSLYRCQNPLDFEFLGGTIDDAAGEAFDKGAALLGLSYPGGPAIQKAAEGGNPRAFRFPRSFANAPDRLQFSFSGLKTALRYQLEKTPLESAPDRARAVSDLAASYQEAIVDALVTKAEHALAKTSLPTLCVGGGVAANRRLRARWLEAAGQGGYRVVFAPPELCTDNAVMGAIAIERLKAGLVESLDLDAQPGLIREG